MKSIKLLAAFTMGAAFAFATDTVLENTSHDEYVTHEYRLHTVTDDKVYGEAIDGNQPGGIVYTRADIEKRIGTHLEEEDVLEFRYTARDAIAEDYDKPLEITLRGYDKPLGGN